MFAIRFAAMLLAVALLAGLSMPASAQETTACNLGANIPEVRVGDSWTYRWREEAQGGLFTEEVTQVGEQQIGVRLTNDRGVFRLTFNRSWNEKSGAVNFHFPLVVGTPIPREWAYTAGVESFKNRERYAVTGCEQVTVPAGSFSAIKIRISGNYSAIGTGNDQWSGTYERMLWYVPGIRRWVKYQLSSTSPTGGTNWVRELQSYSLKE